MGILSILKDLGSKIIGVVSEVVVDRDKKKELEAKVNETLLAFIADNEAEITKRHELDMQSDSWLSKNVRPMTLIFLLTMFVIISVFDGNVGEFQITPSYVPVYEALLMTVFIFYFGSRGFEKGIKIYKNGNKS